MRSFPQLTGGRPARPRIYLRAAALSLTLLAAAVLAGPACNLISQGDDCKAACNVLTNCGLLHTSDCGTYCAATVYSVTMNGCGSEFDAQNSCAKENMDCSMAMTACSSQTTAFNKCVQDYCGSNPTGSGCPGGGDGGTGEGGTGDGG